MASNTIRTFKTILILSLCAGCMSVPPEAVVAARELERLSEAARELHVASEKVALEQLVAAHERAAAAAFELGSRDRLEALRDARQEAVGLYRELETLWSIVGQLHAARRVSDDELSGILARAGGADVRLGFARFEGGPEPSGEQAERVAEQRLNSRNGVAVATADAERAQTDLANLEELAQQIAKSGFEPPKPEPSPEIEGFFGALKRLASKNRELIDSLAEIDAQRRASMSALNELIPGVEKSLGEARSALGLGGS